VRKPCRQTWRHSWCCQGIQLQWWLLNWLRKPRLENSNIYVYTASATKTRLNFVYYPAQNWQVSHILGVFLTSIDLVCPRQGGSAYRLGLCWRLKELPDWQLLRFSCRHHNAVSKTAGALYGCKKNCPSRTLYGTRDSIVCVWLSFVAHMGETKHQLIHRDFVGCSSTVGHRCNVL